MESALKQLLQLPNTWQARHQPRQDAAYPSGFGELDKKLHLGGWPAGATTELLLPNAGHGELRLLLPTLRQRQYQSRWVAMIAPPYTPYAPALQAEGIDTERLLLIYPKNLKDLIWSSVRCLQSEHCSSVFTWGNQAILQDRELRRLQQAATTGRSWFVLMRPLRTHSQSSPSALRMTLQPSSTQSFTVKIIKQRGGWSGQTLHLELPESMSMKASLQRPVYLSQLPRRTRSNSLQYRSAPADQGLSPVLSMTTKQRMPVSVE